MNVSGVSDSMSYLAQTASNMKAEQFAQQLSVSVLKSALDQQKSQGEALVRMMQTGPGSPGSLVDIRA
jgi:hypothetical protein